MKATIYDVAREAGVSIASVSNAINGKGNISKRKRDEIFRVMERLQYRPSTIASALMGKKTYTLGLLIPDVSNPFFAEVARAVEDLAHHAGYSVIVCSTDNRAERVDKYVRLLEQKSVDGLMIGTGAEHPDVLLRLADKSLPIVMIAREVSAMTAHTVLTDDFRGGSLAAGHLLGLGHRRMAVLAENNVTSSTERVRGFRFALFESGLALAGDMIACCESTIADGKRAAAALLARNAGRPTALFCCNDLLAIGALQAAREAGVRVPEQLSVVGFDNTILAAVTNPALTTVAQPIEQIVKLAFDLLVNEQSAGNEPTRALPGIRQRIVMQPELVVRESTAPVQS